MIASGNATVAHDALVEIIGAPHCHGLAVLWALRPPNFQDSALTTYQVIRILLHQALEANNAAEVSAYPIMVAQLRDASGQDD